MKNLFKYLLWGLFFCTAALAQAAVLDGHYSTRGNPRAHGLVLELDYPKKWGVFPGEKPGTVQAFQQYIEGDKIFFLGISLETEVDALSLGWESLGDMIRNKRFIDNYMKRLGGELVSFEPTTVSNYPATRILFNATRGGLRLFGNTLLVAYNNALIEVGKYVVLLDATYAEKKIEEFKTLSLQIDSSIRIEGDHKLTASPEEYYDFNASDYEEFLSGETKLCCIKEQVGEQELSFSFKYPKSWIVANPPNKMMIKAFASNKSLKILKIFGILVDKVPPLAAMEFHSKIKTLEGAKHLFGSTADDTFGIKLINIDGFDGASFYMKKEFYGANCLVKQNLILCGDVLLGFVVNYTGDRMEELRSELKADEKLYDLILESVKFGNPEDIELKTEIITAVVEKYTNKKAKDNSSSLKEGEWDTIAIPEVFSFQVPPTLELSGGVYKDVIDKILKRFEYDTATLTFQQKGLNDLDADAFNEYCRVFIDLKKDRDFEMGFTPITDPIALSQEDLEKLYVSMKEEFENAEDFFVFGKKLKVLSIKKPRIKRINGIDCLYYEQERQLGENPVMHVAKYSFFNYDMQLDVRINYRIKDREKWEEDINRMLASFKFFDRSASNKNIPDDAVVVQCKKRMGHLFVPLKLIGDKGKFETELLFDSGATQSIIPQGIYRALQTKRPSEYEVFSTAAGDKTLPVSEMSIEIGGVKRETDIAIGSDIDGGVLGLNFFAGYNYIIDMQKNKIYFWKK